MLHRRWGHWSVSIVPDGISIMWPFLVKWKTKRFNGNRCKFKTKQCQKFFSSFFVCFYQTQSINGSAKVRLICKYHGFGGEIKKRNRHTHNHHPICIVCALCVREVLYNVLLDSCYDPFCRSRLRREWTTFHLTINLAVWLSMYTENGNLHTMATFWEVQMRAVFDVQSTSTRWP